MWNDREEIIGLGVRHPRGLENILPHVVHVFLRRGAFQHTAEKRVAVRRVVEFRSRFRDQRIGSENLQRLFHAREMAGTILGNVSFSVAVVMADASQVGKQTTRGNRPLFLWKHTAKLLAARVQGQISPPPKIEKRSSR